ncbi:MAG: hypothetical protein JRH17_18575 [Deltaproteobacteria bacterium]|nr:hypothetical protein [Deltaproteobacteria bacterium]
MPRRIFLINHDRALAGGVSVGDSAGYPVTISQSGHYLLTGNLTQPDANTHVIEITTDRVMLHLGGHSILGSAFCSVDVNSRITGCTGGGTGSGIVATGSLITIRNGLINGMGNRAIDMSVGEGFTIREVAISHSGGDGIVLGGVSFFFDSAIGRNGGSGIRIGDGARLINTTASSNGGGGLVGGVGITVQNGGFSANIVDGISVGNAAFIDSATVFANLASGIEVALTSKVTNSLIVTNAGTGLLFTGAAVGTSGYAGNVVNFNTTAQVSGADGIELGTNICGLDTTCP